MGLLENMMVRSDLREGQILSRVSVKWTQEVGPLESEEKKLLTSYFLGYWLVQKSGEFESYENLPYYKFLRLIPSIQLVVNSAHLASRIGKELLDESADMEYILKDG